MDPVVTPPRSASRWAPRQLVFALRAELAALRPHLSLSPTAFTPVLGGRSFSWSYGVFAALVTLWVALRFYSELKLQLFYANVQRGSLQPPFAWSAPLDDVFIHFDFARSAAQGYPFRWLVENGYSSGGTSLLYPLFLAVGYLVGFTGTGLMLWSAVLACVWVLSTLLIGRVLFLRAGLPGLAPYFLPPLFLGVGVLSWSLFSGMEVALLLCAWSLALLAWLHFAENPVAARATLLWRALPFGLANAVLVATRPEAVVWVWVFLAFSLPALKGFGLLRGFAALVVAGAPAASVLIGHQIANRVFTGDWSAAGALVKLEFYHPYWTAAQAVDSWKFFIEYQIQRMTEHHLGANGVLGPWRSELPGKLLYWLAAVPLLSVATRRYAALLWCCVFAWLMMVALNGQVRWQNDRYTVPALALLLLSASLGLGVIAGFVRHARLPKVLRAAAAAGAGVLLWLLITAQHSQYRDQVWFFARASRNIYEQHMTTALALRSQSPAPRRVLLGDAGAIPYLSQLPALDIIGLGGYHDLPFARASRLGVGAIVELIERMPVAERPDTFAIYPTWWGDLPAWFGRQRFAVPVRGNVICGGAAKVVYQANWQPLHESGRPFSPLFDQVIKDSLDVADVVSERQHQQRVEGAPGFVVMKLLPHPQTPANDLWDAGRAIPSGATLHFSLRELDPQEGSTLLVRLTATAGSRFTLGPRGGPAVELSPGKMGWEEIAVALPPGAPAPGLNLTLQTLQGEVVVHHIWALQKPKNR